VPGRKFPVTTSARPPGPGERLPRRAGQVGGNGPLVPVDGPEQQRRVTVEEPPAAQLVPGDGPLDLDDLGAEVGKQARGERGGDVAAQFQDPDADHRPRLRLQ
jgi:hypothetical protein